MLIQYKLLAIEFNRDADQVKLALEVLIELEMIEVSEHNIYSVKNFAKHQNIKVKEKKKKSNKKNKKDNIEKENEEDKMVWFSEGEERPLAKARRKVQ